MLPCVNYKGMRGIGGITARQ